MGNLFSSASEETRHRQEAARAREEQLRRLEYQNTLRRQREANRQLKLQQRWLSELQKQHQPVIERTPTTSLYTVNSVIQHNTTALWASMASNETVKYVRLATDSREYRDIATLFQNTNKKFFKVSHIERVQNPYLYGAYLLKQEELSCRFGHAEERFMFHGTKERNIDGICEDNFDWRRHGNGTGHRFGKGVSFSPISNYATHYCDKYSSTKVMLVVKVLVAQSCVGNSEMTLPPAGYDTTQKPGGHVIVKYEDNEFYPAYKLYFHKTRGAFNGTVDNLRRECAN